MSKAVRGCARYSLSVAWTMKNPHGCEITSVGIFIKLSAPLICKQSPELLKYFLRSPLSGFLTEKPESPSPESFQK